MSEVPLYNRLRGRAELWDLPRAELVLSKHTLQGYLAHKKTPLPP